MKPNRQSKSPASKSGKLAWRDPSLKYVGQVGEVLQGGGGKLSTSGGDPGDNRKQSGNN
jgi:hypothetical protein